MLITLLLLAVRCALFYRWDACTYRCRTASEASLQFGGETLWRLIVLPPAAPNNRSFISASAFASSREQNECLLSVHIPKEMSQQGEAVSYLKRGHADKSLLLSRK